MEGENIREPEEISVEQEVSPAEMPFPKGVPLEMYEISGQDKITEHSFERYEKNKDQDEAILKAVRNPVISNESKKAHSVQWRPTSPSAEARRKQSILDGIKKALPDQKAHVFQGALKSEDQEFQISLFDFLDEIPKNDIASLLEFTLENSDSAVKNEALKALGRYQIPKSETASLIEKGLRDKDCAVQRGAASAISYGPADRVNFFREIVMENIKNGLNSSKVEDQFQAISMVPNIQEEERRAILEQALNNPNPIIQEEAVIIGNTYIPQNERADFVKLCLECPNSNVRKEMMKAARFLSPEDKKYCFDLIRNLGLENEFIEPPLYEGQKLDKKNFSKKKFGKTGSSTVLFGGELKDKTILRKLTPKAFLAWQRLFEDYKFWETEKMGSERPYYVPIEPIQSYKLRKTGEVDIYSGVLDLSLQDWKLKTDGLVESQNFLGELEEQKEKILHAAYRLGITHGHVHDGNFCLRFFRDKNGKADLSRCPRIYMIDFDQAVSH